MKKEPTKNELKKLKSTLDELSQALVDSYPENKKILESKLLRFNVELAKMNLEDFPKIKKRAFWAILISVVSIICNIFLTLVF